ncbi:hypothetical protein EYF80_054114 [Liparis tanakae]|uniref:Uncharacterized protein n=1 Tax=Liparis tanakae TaxID=230148 RepID=A0A4Z2F4B3_9TELE|nr:hypothetical protein EYF80_054114 [Liparis tanakae]
MAGFTPGLLPTNHSQEKEFAQAYEDVLERYKALDISLLVKPGGNTWPYPSSAEAQTCRRVLCSASLGEFGSYRFVVLQRLGGAV